jgi:hypothetical protein
MSITEQDIKSMKINSFIVKLNFMRKNSARYFDNNCIYKGLNLFRAILYIIDIKLILQYQMD